MWSALPKTQRRIVYLSYSPCDDTPTAATVSLTTYGVLPLVRKNIFFVSFILLLRYMVVATLHLSLQL
jgi:hypothetical protein